MFRSTCFFDGAFNASFGNLPKREKHEIVRQFWPKADASLDSFDEHSYNSFLNYVGQEIGHLRNHPHHLAVQTLEGTFNILHVLRENRFKAQSEIIQILSGDFLHVEEAAIRRSMELSVRLWLTLNVNTSDVAIGPTFPNETPLDWEYDTSLEDLVQVQFLKGTGMERRSQRIDPALTAAYLANTCGMNLRWTDSISDHLRFDPTRQILTVYRHKICLVSHLESEDGCPIPTGVLSEILDTLNLLFPFGDLATKQLLIKELQQPLYQLGNCGRQRKLDLQDYDYFREELKYLIDSFDRPPRTWRQLANDRRNKLEWSAFWVTVMVAFLTAVSIPCSIIQTTYSVKAYRATLAQMNES